MITTMMSSTTPSGNKVTGHFSATIAGYDNNAGMIAGEAKKTTGDSSAIIGGQGKKNTADRPALVHQS